MTDLEILLDEINRIDGCRDTIERVRYIMKTLAGRRIHFAKSQLIRPDHVALAKSMRAAGMTRAEVAAALVIRLNVSARTAYRVIDRSMESPITGDLFRAAQP